MHRTIAETVNCARRLQRLAGKADDTYLPRRDDRRPLSATEWLEVKQALASSGEKLAAQRARPSPDTIRQRHLLFRSQRVGR